MNSILRGIIYCWFLSLIFHGSSTAMQLDKSIPSTFTQKILQNKKLNVHVGNNKGVSISPKDYREKYPEKFYGSLLVDLVDIHRKLEDLEECKGSERRELLGFQEKILLILLENPPPSAELVNALEQDFSFVHLAAAAGHVELLEKLLSIESVEVDTSFSQPDDGCSQGSPHEASQFSFSSPTLLLKPKTTAITPLMVAVSHGQIEAIKILIKRGAGLWATNGLSETPLKIAVRLNNKEIIKVLIWSCLEKKGIKRQEKLNYTSKDISDIDNIIKIIFPICENKSHLNSPKKRKRGETKISSIQRDQIIIYEVKMILRSQDIDVEFLERVIECM